MTAREDGFVASVLSNVSAPPERPFITLTWAQTLDFKLASAAGQPRLLISGTESMRITFRLRAAHDAILVGIDTLLADDSQLNVRDLPEELMSQPLPVIIDPHLRTPLSARLFSNARAGRGRLPLLLHLDGVEEGRKRVLSEAGAELLVVQDDSSGRIDLAAALQALKARGIATLMVEGGLRIISSLLSARLVDRLVITVGPTFPDRDARGPLLTEELRLETLRTEVYGRDAVFACTLVS